MGLTINSVDISMYQVLVRTNILLLLKSIYSQQPTKLQNFSYNYFFHLICFYEYESLFVFFLKIIFVFIITEALNFELYFV